jgi:hypothetical protein
VIIFAKTDKAYRWLVKFLNRVMFTKLTWHWLTGTRQRLPAGLKRRLNVTADHALAWRLGCADRESQLSVNISQMSDLRTFLPGSSPHHGPHTPDSGSPELFGCASGGRHALWASKSKHPHGSVFLHAKSLTLRLPGDRTARTFEAPLPDDLQIGIIRHFAREERFDELD